MRRTFAFNLTDRKIHLLRRQLYRLDPTAQSYLAEGETSLLILKSASILLGSFGVHSNYLKNRPEARVPPTRSSVAKDTHRRIVHERAGRRLTPRGIDLPTIDHANGRNRCCAHAPHFDALRDERTGDENRLLNHFLPSLRADLDRRIGKRGTGRD